MTHGRWGAGRSTAPSTPPSVSTGVLWIPEHVLRLMAEEADGRAPDETGGVLLGYWAVPPSLAPLHRAEGVVTAVVGPGPRAEHRRATFSPDHDYHEREIARLYDASERRWAYLGDWHSHPDGTARLSEKDLTTMTRIATEPAARAPHPVMLLLVGGEPWEPHAWIGTLQNSPFGRWGRPRIAARLADVRVFST